MAERTTGEVLAGALEILAGIDGARLDAEVLLSHVTGRSRALVMADRNLPVPEQQVNHYQQLISRRGMGEPLAHLVGHREFWSLQLEVNRHVLVPRPETELLVERVLALASERRVRSVLDLGTGSGAIALAIASELPHCAVVATDCSAAALSVARRNARNLDLQSVDIRMGDWFQAVPGMQFDVIVSNPPYVSPDDLHLRGTDLRFEPQQALLAAENGLADIRKLVNSAGGYLESGGVLLLEHGCDQGENVRELLRRGGFGAIKTCRDLAGLERVTLGHGVDGSPR